LWTEKEAESTEMVDSTAVGWTTMVAETPNIVGVAGKRRFSNLSKQARLLKH
jgi:hypothetical protein